MSKPVLAELEIEHECWGIDLSQMYNGVKLLYTPIHSPNSDVTAWLADVRTSSPKEALNYIKTHPHIQKATVLNSTSKGTLVYVLQKVNTLFLESAIRYNGVPIDNPTSIEGLDRVVLMFPKEKNLRRMLAELRDDFIIHPRSKIYVKNDLSLDFFKTSGFINLKGVSEILTQRQKDVFHLACQRGYYSNPQEISLAELAQEFGLHHNTVSEHLRRAESKLMPVMGKILKQL